LIFHGADFALKVAKIAPIQNTDPLKKRARKEREGKSGWPGFDPTNHIPAATEAGTGHRSLYNRSFQGHGHGPVQKKGCTFAGL